MAFSGDFTVQPPTLPADLGDALVGCALTEDALGERVADYYRRVSPEAPGVMAGDWVAAVMRATSVEMPA
jgi:hypothetical protein